MTQKPKWTPGPWSVKRLGDGNDKNRIGRVIGPDGLPICAFVGRNAYRRRGAESVEADAHLIAAAPPMAEALETAPTPPSLPLNRDEWTEIYLRWTTEKYVPWLQTKARTALAAAKGERP